MHNQTRTSKIFTLIDLDFGKTFQKRNVSSPAPVTIDSPSGERAYKIKFHEKTNQIININTTATTVGGHTSYGRRHIVPSAVSLANVYAPLAKSACECGTLSQAREAGFLPISAGKASYK